MFFSVILLFFKYCFKHHRSNIFNISGDRIAIMSGGVVQCCGSSLFLKNKYGVGYHMVMVKSENCNVESVTSVIRRHVKGACLENDVGKKAACHKIKSLCHNFRKSYFVLVWRSHGTDG